MKIARKAKGTLLGCRKACQNEGDARTTWSSEQRGALGGLFAQGTKPANVAR